MLSSDNIEAIYMRMANYIESLPEKVDAHQGKMFVTVEMLYNINSKAHTHASQSSDHCLHS